jgi:tRNA (guanine-N7-)-methyltransferase
LGCGRGEYTIGLAQRFPDKNFIGIDIKGARMWHGAKIALEAGMKNVAFLRTNIEIIDAFFAPNEVAELWLTFSDPQMKKATKRLTSTYFMERYRRFLIDGGIIHVKTDSNFLATYTKYMIEKNGLPLEQCTFDLYAEKEMDASLTEIRTYYEGMWLERGIPIKYLQFHLPHNCPLEEPDIEIPVDGYRSYDHEVVSTKKTGK